MEKLDYRYEFAPHELEAIEACNNEHGFAIVKGLLSPDCVEELKTDVRRAIDPAALPPAGSRYDLDFVERAPALWKLFQDEAYLQLMFQLMGTKECTIHRSAAIVRNPGAPGMGWHSDFSFFPDPPRTCGDVLNAHEGPSGMWFYLNGTHPSRGGLALIPHSHRPDWDGPEGFEFTANRGTFYRKGEAPAAHLGMDVPGMLAVESDPGDMILFAARTYHGVFPHGGDEPRLSCAVGCRPASLQVDAPWRLPASAIDFLRDAPDYLQPYLHGYTGIVGDWTPGHPSSKTPA